MVLDDYSAVLPLPRGRWWRAWTQVQRPFFTQQCGPGGRRNPATLSALLNAIPSRRRPVDFPLAEGLSPESIPTRFTASPRTNLVLLLDDDPTKSYHKTLRKKLRRYPTPSLEPIDPAMITDIYREAVGERVGLQAKHYRAISRLMQLNQPGLHQLLVGLRNEEGELLAAGYFPSYRGRTINLFAASTPAGYRQDGMARLLDAVIRHRRDAGDRLFDFEGSDLPGVAEFFRSFGGEERTYLRLS